MVFRDGYSDLIPIDVRVEVNAIVGEQSQGLHSHLEDYPSQA